MDAGLKRKSEDQSQDDFEKRAKKSYLVRSLKILMLFGLSLS